MQPEVGTSRCAKTQFSRASERFKLKVFAPLRLINVLAIFILALAWLKQPEVVLILNPDASWQGVLAFAAAHHLQFGKDIIFSYGPLGYLDCITYVGIWFYRIWMWKCFSTVVMAGLLWLIVQKGGWADRVTFALTFAFLAQAPIANMDDGFYLFAILAVGLLGISGNASESRASWFLLPFVAALGLIKFNLLIYSSCVVSLVLFFHCLRRDWRRAALSISALPFCYVLGWCLAGQQLFHLPAYFRTSLQVASGYGQAMNLNQNPQWLPVALLMLAGLGGLLAAEFCLSPHRLMASPKLLMIGCGLFVAWKCGFVRDDIHIYHFLVFSMLTAAAIPILLPNVFSFSRKFRLIPAGVMILGCVSLPALGQGIYPAIAQRLAKRIPSALRATLSPSERLRGLDAELLKSKKQHDLPRFKALIKDGTVDALGFCQAIVLLNGFNYAPRPSFQSYNTYTPDLEHANLDYYASPKAPEFVLLDVQSIDDRLPLLDGGPLIRILFQSYELAAMERNILLWRKQASPQPPPPLQLVREADLSLEQLVKVPSRPLWMECQMQCTWWGKLRSLLYQPPSVFIEMIQGGNQLSAYRFVPPFAEAGCIVNPHFPNERYLVKYLTGRGAEWSDFTLHARGRGFRDRYHVRLYAMPELENPIQDNLRYRRLLFPILPALPLFVNASSCVLDYIGETEVLVMRAPSDFELPVPNSASSVTGRHILSPEAYTSAQMSSGVEFVIEFEDKDGQTQVLYRRLLSPNNPAERDFHSYSLALPPGGGRLRFHIGSGPNGPSPVDYGAWAAVQIK